jgi:hypothetical protein
MINTKKYLRIAAIIIIVSFLPIPSINGLSISADIDYSSSHTTLEDVGKIGLAIGAVGLVTYGAAQLGSWLWGKTDEKILRQAQQAYEQSTAHYLQMMSLIQSQFPGGEIDNPLVEIPESMLYQMAMIKYHTSGIVAYISQLKSTVQELEGYLKDLRKRMYTIKTQLSEHHDATVLYKHMKHAEQQLKSILPPLRLIHICLKTHESFFELFELEDILAYRYERDLSTLHMYRHDTHYLIQMIHQSIMLQQTSHHDLYPYHWYVNRLNSDITILSTKIDNLLCNYPNRRSVAMTLYTDLQDIKQLIVAAPYYAQELRAIENAQFMSAAIAAQEHHAQELAHQNAIAEQQLLLQQQTHVPSHHNFDDDF